MFVSSGDSIPLSAGLLTSIRLAALVMMKGAMNAFACHFGIKCSSLCKVNIGTSMRSACTSIGCLLHASVRTSNKLLERNLVFGNAFLF